MSITGSGTVKIALLAVGKLKEEPERQLVARYLERFQQMGAPLGFGTLSTAELAESRAASSSLRKAAEATELRKRLTESTQFVALDERGSALTSQEFAQKLGAWRDGGVRSLAFVIGGPDGLDPGLLTQARLVLSLGRLTLPHGLARVVLAEQLYRAVTLLAGHPYHRA